jgi:dolichol kinase
MLQCTSGEFAMILSLLEILFPNLCLFLIINVYIKFYKGYRCVCSFSRLVLDQRNSKRKFGSRRAYLFLYAFILFVVNRNAIFDVFILLLKQVCMCEQWLALDLLSSVSNPLGVI